MFTGKMTYSNYYLAHGLGSQPDQVYQGSADRIVHRPYDSLPSVTDAQLDQTVEELLSRGTRKTHADPLDNLIFGRGTNLREQIREILFQLQLRDGLVREFQQRSAHVVQDVRSELLNLASVVRWMDPVIEKRRAGLESRLDTIYREQFRSRLDFWKDQRDLREQLVELLGQYRLAVARDQLLTDLRYGGGE